VTLISPGLFLLLRGLFLFPQLLDEQTHLFRPGRRERIFTTEIEIIPQPFSVIGVARDRYHPLLKDSEILLPNVRWNDLHGQGSNNRLTSENSY